MTIEIHQPELEAHLQSQMSTGRFATMEDVLVEALLGRRADGLDEKASKKSVGQMLAESPLYGSGIVLERLKDEPRMIDLG